MKRRTFLRGIGATTLTATVPRLALAQATPTNEPRMKLALFVANPARVATLKRGVKVMKAREPSDPTSWFFQAAIHGVTDAAIADATKLDPAVARVDQTKVWNQCPHFGNAASAEFAIWHRGYVHYFERILRAASGDPSFSLPYWDYSDPAQRGCPLIFADPEPAVANGPATNPLYDARRELAWVQGLYDLSERAVSTATAFSKPTYFAAKAQDAFGGAADDLEPRQQGWLERSPHNGIHFAIGGVISTDGLTVADTSAAGLMADPTTAGFDPIFWVHHSNIDRLWNVWGRQPNVAWGPAPPAGWLDAAPWSFHDADGSLKQLPRRHYIDAKALGVAFDDDDPAVLTLSSKPISATLAGSGQSLSERGGFKSLGAVGTNSAGVTLSATAPTKATVVLAPSLSTRPNHQQQWLSIPLRHVILELQGVMYDGPPSVGFTLIVSLGGTDGRLDLGPINLFGLRHGSHMHAEGAGQRFDISSLFEGSPVRPSHVELSIMPYDLLAPGPRANGTPPPRRAGNVRIMGFKITVETPNFAR